MDKPLKFGDQHPLPNRRRGCTWEASISDTKILLRTSEYDNGSLGEIAIELPNQGIPFQMLMQAFSRVVTMGLQHGTPLDAFVEAFTFSRFEPAGMVQGSEYLKNATSILDYVFRELAIKYDGRTDLAHIIPEQSTHSGPQLRLVSPEDRED